MRRSTIVIACAIAALMAVGIGSGGVFALKAVQQGDLFFAQHTADDAIKAFNDAGLATINVKTIDRSQSYWNIQAKTARSFTSGQFSSNPYFVYEFGSKAERDTAWNTLADLRGMYPPRFLVKDNLIFVYLDLQSSAAPSRYEAVFLSIR